MYYNTAHVRCNFIWSFKALTPLLVVILAVGRTTVSLTQSLGSTSTRTHARALHISDLVKVFVPRILLLLLLHAAALYSCCCNLLLQLELLW